MTEREQVIEELKPTLDNCYLEVGRELQKLALPPALRAKIINQLFTKRYPSGNPMIGILKDDQTLPDYWTKTRLYPNGINTMRHVFTKEQKEALGATGWRRIVGEK